MRPSFPVLAAALLAACTGEIGSGAPHRGAAGDPATPPAAGPSSPGAPAGPADPGALPDEPERPSTDECATRAVAEVAASPVRRLSHAEYDRTVRDLLGTTLAPGRAFAADREVRGFDNHAAALHVPPVLAEQYLEAAHALADEVDVAALLGCEPAALSEGCGEAFVARFGRRALRRPLAEDEALELVGFLDEAAAAYGPEEAVRLLVAALLQSPDFLYRLEDEAPETAEVGPYELASRLSYFLWGSTPSDALLDAAASGALATREGVEAEAVRLLSDARAREQVDHFHRQWLELAEVERLAKDPALQPGWDPALAGAAGDGLLAFARHVVFEGEGTVEELLLAPYGFGDERVAALHGASPPDASGRFELDPEVRVGLLGQAGFLAVFAKPSQSSPVQRGRFVRERLLCQDILPPPGDVVLQVPDASVEGAAATTRERYARHTSETACYACHRLMDPIGFGLEHFDEVGAYRSRDGGQPVDATGEILEGGDAEGAFDGAPALAARLAGSERVRRCLATQWFRFAAGREEQPDDGCARNAIEQAFADAGGDLRELLVAIAASDTFRLKRSAP